MRSYKPLLKEIEGYPTCVVKDAPMHLGDFWTVNKLDVSAFCIHRSPEGELIEVWVTLYVYNDEGEHVKYVCDENGGPAKLVHAKINPYTFEIVGMDVIEGNLIGKLTSAKASRCFPSGRSFTIT